MTGRRAQGIIALCWVLSIIIGLTPMMGWYKTPKEEPESPDDQQKTPKIPNECPPGLIKCLFEEVVLMEYMVFFNFFGCVLLPLLIMLGIYVCIFMAARHQLKLIKLKVVYGEKSGSTMQKEIQAAKSLAIIVGLFAVCWLPLHIINCVNLFCDECDPPPEFIMYMAIILSHGNSVINPFIYAYRIQEFRRTFRKIIRRRLLARCLPLEISGSGSARTSIYNSVTESVRHINGLRVDLDNEQGSSSSSCESPCRCPADVSSVRGGLIAVSHAPLSIIISRCPHTISCPRRGLRQTRSSVHGDEQHAAGRRDGGAPDNVLDKQDLDAAQVTVLLNEGKSNSCFTELALMS